jgi:hypothetical protein
MMDKLVAFFEADPVLALLLTGIVVLFLWVAIMMPIYMDMD